QVACDSVNLIRQCKSVLLEVHAIARFGCQAPRVGIPGRLAHPGHPSKAFDGSNVGWDALIPRTETRHCYLKVRRPLDGLKLAQAAAGHLGEDRRSGRALVVPGK